MFPSNSIYGYSDKNIVHYMDFTRLGLIVLFFSVW